MTLNEKQPKNHSDSQTQSACRSEAALGPPVCNLSFFATCHLRTRTWGTERKGLSSRSVGDLGSTFHSLLPSPKPVSPISVHSNAHSHILSEKTKETNLLLLEPCFLDPQAQLRSRSTTRAPGSESPSAPYSDTGEGLGPGAAVPSGSSSAQEL